MNKAGKTSLGIYIHVPVCETLCNYCDFYSIKSTSIDSTFWEDYMYKITEELAYKLPLIQDNEVLNSIYFGGGTPSLAPPYFIEKLLNHITDKIPRKYKKIEITLEANPETVTPEFLATAADFGINRISMGVQSLNDRILTRLGRIGTRYNSIKAMEYLANSSIENWSADIIYGIPGQSESDVIDTLQIIKSFNAKHISAYALTLENGLMVQPDYRGERISEKKQFTHQEIIWNYLPASGFSHYEVSNFARKGYECLHNIAVWKYRPYLSLGVSGHSFLRNYRYHTISNIQRYLTEPLKKIIVKEKAKTIPDLFITGLRLKTWQGVCLYKRHLNKKQMRLWMKQLENFQTNEWVKLGKNGFLISKSGLNFSNSMIESVFENLV